MRKYALLLTLIILTGCNSVPAEVEISWLSYKGADMPVVVQGNVDSGVFIIYLHGGPGGSSFIDLQNGYFNEIEQSYAVVYYDQRSSGNSKGHSPSELLTLEQFIEDLEVITAYVDEHYSPRKKVLLGHSWGGTLGTAFLLEPENRSLYDAWIEVDGGHNIGDSAFSYSKDYVVEKAEQHLSVPDLTNAEIKKWTEIRDYYSGLTSWRDTAVIIDHSGMVTEAGGYFYNPEIRDTVVSLNQIMFSETDFIGLLAQNKYVVTNMDIWRYDFTSRLNEIDIPVMVLWGLYDGILPVQLGLEAIDAYALPADRYYIFEESAHSPHYEQTALFNRKVLDFLDSVL